MKIYHCLASPLYIYDIYVELSRVSVTMARLLLAEITLAYHVHNTRGIFVFARISRVSTNNRIEIISSLLLEHPISQML